jgi:N6-adenosine-specific RNA methylase IME4/ParB-like chromosome segregation protein Spo0J
MRSNRVQAAPARGGRSVPAPANDTPAEAEPAHGAAPAESVEQLRPLDALRAHERSELVPRMSAEAYRAFSDDIGARGIIVPLEITSEDVVLDGRERLRAAGELGLELVPVRIVAPEDEVEFMLLAALERRQLSPSQRAALAVELGRYRELRVEGKRRQRANLRRSTEVAELPPRGKSRDKAAAWAGVSARTIQDAATVRELDDDLFQQVKAGKLPVDVAARRVRRARRDATLPAAPPLPEGLFEVIYPDCPWQMGNPDGPYAPENYYPTMPLAEIKALEIPSAADAICFLWAVNSLLPEALEVLAAWGFEYKTNFAWVKPSPALGRWHRGRHELLLVGTKGDFPAPEPEDCPESVIEAPRGRHSEKPACVYELLERMYPEASKLELFARGKPRPGWTAWGNEIEG